AVSAVRGGSAGDRQASQDASRGRNAAGASPAVLCGADPRPRPALYLRLSEQEGDQTGLLVRIGESRGGRTGRGGVARRWRDHHLWQPGRRNRRARTEERAKIPSAKLDRRAGAGRAGLTATDPALGSRGLGAADLLA